jgi:pSer/pThr/pTyr-binding forkhead associated (FHA) protein
VAEAHEKSNQPSGFSYGENWSGVPHSAAPRDLPGARMSSQRTKNDWNDESTSEISVTLLPLSTEQSPSVLELVQGPGAPRKYDLYAAEMVVGRAIDADVPINSTDLSRRHVVVKRNASNQYSLLDLESRNGVYVNGVKVHSAILHDGDNVQLGSLVFVFHEGRTS